MNITVQNDTKRANGDATIFLQSKTNMITKADSKRTALKTKHCSHKNYTIIISVLAFVAVTMLLLSLFILAL